jgi:mono/diheme cytochrome c family protein
MLKHIQAEILKMKFKQHFLTITASCAMLFGIFGCQQAGGESTGSEMIPDMAHSVAYEANVLTNYSFNSFDEQSVMSRRELSQPRLPVNGTIPRGYAGIANYNGVYGSAEGAVVTTMNRMKDGGIAYTANGHVPYAYPDSEEGRTLAIQQIRYNPFPITEAGLAKGKELYNIYCGICHGEKGDGGGYLVRDNGGKYPAQPANLVDSQFVFSTNGRFYHGIVYGKNAMGGYADKLSFEERWQVIHYIRSLQATARKAKYDPKANTLVAEYGVPEALVPKPTPTPPPSPLPNDGKTPPTGDDHSHGDSEGHSTSGGH